MNHVGVVIQTVHGFFVLEAFPPEVRLTKLEVFSRRSHDKNSKPRLMFGELVEEHQNLIPKAVEYGIRQRNLPYDKLYLTGESELYCSELVIDMFKSANGNVPFFEERPMSFRDNTTGELHPSWEEYYQYFGMRVPTGEPGSNPGDISSDKRISIFDIVGDIPGLS